MPSWSKYLDDDEQAKPSRMKSKAPEHKHSENAKERLVRANAEKVEAQAKHKLQKNVDKHLAVEKDND